MIAPMAKTAPNPEGVELAKRVGHQSRYYLLSPGKTGGGELRVLYGGFEQCLPDYRIARSGFPHHCLEVIVGGQGEVEVADDWCELGEGWVFLYRPGLTWRMRGAGNEGLRKFFVVFDGFDGHGSAAGLSKERQVPFRFEPLWELVALLEALEREAGHPSGERQSICSCLLESILRKLWAREPLQDAPRSRSRRTYLEAVQFIEEHYRELKSAAGIAKRVGVDSSYLCRLFQRYGAMSPYRYLTRLRMQYAMTLLTREGLDVTSVADALGFENPFHFSRVFKSVHGLPPSAYFRTIAD